MYGKLGHGNENGHSTPKRVEALVGLVVSMIACGSRHTAVVTSPEGNLYTWYVLSHWISLVDKLEIDVIA